jgi:hypothetical protein
VRMVKHALWVQKYTHCNALQILSRWLLPCRDLSNTGISADLRDWKPNVFTATL